MKQSLKAYLLNRGWRVCQISCDSRTHEDAHERHMMNLASLFIVILLGPTEASFGLPGFPRRTARLSSGAQVSLYNEGPPVLFSSGLFGTMSRRIYSDLFRELTDITLIVLDDLAPVRKNTLEETADALGVETIGFLSHSSIDVDVLSSSRLQSAVLCDPVAIPTFDASSMSLQQTRVKCTAPVLVVRAGNAYRTETPIPKFLAPDVECRVESLGNVGHADVLNDFYADLAPKMFPWMRGTTQPLESFAAWSERDEPVDRQTRAQYRTAIAQLASRHFLGDDGPAAQMRADAQMRDV